MLPAAKQPDREDLPGVVKATVKPLSREEARRSGRLILIAEDNEINQKVILNSSCCRPRHTFTQLFAGA